jgi:hypothetical protein
MHYMAKSLVHGSIAGGQQRLTESLQGSPVKIGTTQGKSASREDGAARKSGSVLIFCPLSKDALGRGRGSVRENPGDEKPWAESANPSWLGCSALARATRVESRWRNAYRKRRPPKNAKAVAPKWISRGSNPGHIDGDDAFCHSATD